MRRIIPINCVLRNASILTAMLSVCGVFSLHLASAGLQHTAEGDAQIHHSNGAAIQTLSSASDHFRSKIAGPWQNITVWESSLDSTNWVSATLVPNHLSSSVLIWNNNTIQVDQNLSIDQVVIIEGGTLRLEAGTITLMNGLGDDITVRANGVLQFSGGNAPQYQNSSSRIRVKAGGIVRVNSNITNLSQNLAGNGSSGRFIYETGAVFNWNNSFPFTTAGQTYFPDAAPDVWPIFRITQGNVTAGASSATTFNGVVEVNANAAFSQSGTKFFRNGITGSSQLTQTPGSGKFVISGDSAVLGGIGSISLQSSSGSNLIETGANTYITLLTNKAINASGGGVLVIKGTSTLDTKTFGFSGSAGVLLESDTRHINAHTEGLHGAFGSLDQDVDFESPNKQTVVFNRIGLQTSGPGYSLSVGRFIVTNGSKLTLSGMLNINNLDGGYLKVEGAGSELRAAAARTITIAGDRSLILENGGIMHASCLQFINLLTDFADGMAVLNGNGQPIRCKSLSTTKISGGGMTIAPNTNLEIGTSLTVNYFDPAVFTDNGNTISVGSFLQMTGSTGAPQYNLTGTIIMTGVGAGSSSFYIGSQSSGAIHAELNNLIINSTYTGSFPRFNPSAGGATIRIKGDFTIQNCAVNQPVRPYGNTLRVGGNWTNIHENRFLQATSTIIFDGENDQTIACAGGEVFSNLEIDKPTGDLFLSSNLRLTGLGVFSAGLVHTGDNLLEFGNGALASGASQSSYANGRVRKTGFTADQPFEFPVGDFEPGTDGRDVFQPAALETASSSATASFDVMYIHENFNAIFDDPWNPPTVGIGSVSTCNYWMIDRTAGSLGAKVGLTWNEAQCFDVTEPASLLVARYDEDAEDWSEANFPGLSTATFSPAPLYTTGWVTTNHLVNHFSPFAIGNIGSGLNVLPIELGAFHAQAAGPTVQAKWATYSETNNDFFTLERSQDAEHWNPVGQIDGAGNSQLAIEYAFTDDGPYPGRSYYRLKQTDFDGAFSHSEIRAVWLDSVESYVSVFREGEKVGLILRSAEPSAELEILDIAGKRVHHESVETSAGTVYISPNLTSGVYLLRVSGQKTTQMVKFFY